MQQQIHKPLKPIVVGENHPVETIAQESQVQLPELDATPAKRHSFSPEFLSLVVLGLFLLVYAILCRRLFNSEEDHTTSRYARKIPCKHCRFFSSNPYPYLQCAVHPSRALKFDAIHCPDYDPKYSNVSLEDNIKGCTKTLQ